MEIQGATLYDTLGNPVAGRSLIQTVLPDNSPTVDFTGLIDPQSLDALYTRYIIEVDKLVPSVDSDDFHVLFSIGGAFKESVDDYSWAVLSNRTSTTGSNTSQEDAASYINVARETSNEKFGTDSKEDWDLVFTLGNLGDLASLPKISWEGWGINDNNHGQRISGMGLYRGLGSSGIPPIDGIRFEFAAGLISSGTFRLYGQE